MLLTRTFYMSSYLFQLIQPPFFQVFSRSVRKGYHLRLMKQQQLKVTQQKHLFSHVLRMKMLASRYQVKQSSITAKMIYGWRRTEDAYQELAFLNHTKYENILEKKKNSLFSTFVLSNTYCFVDRDTFNMIIVLRTGILLFEVWPDGRSRFMSYSTMHLQTVQRRKLADTTARNFMKLECRFKIVFLQFTVFSNHSSPAFLVFVFLEIQICH